MNTLDFIKRSRKKLKLTQAGLAELLSTSRENIANYETRVVAPGDIVLKIQDLLSEQITSNNK